ncbi:GlxA family transcriptional regulator [Cupriavidus sp. Marseille-Q8015]
MHDFTILILENAYPASVAVTLDILAAAAALAPRAGVSRPRWKVCSVGGKDIALQNGLSVATSKLSGRPRNDRSTWVLPGMGVEQAAAIGPRLACADAVKAIAAIARHVQAGGRVAASCSSVFLLQAAGVLQGRRVTTTWWLAPFLKRMSPDIVVDADRMVCADGPVVTAGAAFAQTDLMLHLVREHFGSALVDAVSRMLLIDGRQAQTPFVMPEIFASGDDLVARLAVRIEKSLPNSPTVAELAQEFCMSKRTLSRHLQRVTGRTTLALIQSVKLRRARALLESSRMTVEQVAEAVGYQDSTALRRMMKRVAGANPSRYRPAIAAAQG